MSKPEIVYLVYETIYGINDSEKIVRYGFYDRELAEKCVKLLQEQEELRIKYDTELYELTGVYNEYSEGLKSSFSVEPLVISDADDEEEDDETEEL